jgi:hypothetical protein
MQLFGRGFMITFTEVPADLKADFHEWYNREHLDERLDLPGFRRARRYESLDGPIRYVTTYECGGPDDIGSPAYLDVLARQTEWSARIMPRFAKWHRLTGRVVVDETHGFGGAIAMLRMRPPPGQAQEMARWLARGVLGSVTSLPGIVGACAVAGNPAADARLARAFGREPDTAQPPEWAILIEGMDPETVREAAYEGLRHIDGFAGDGVVSREMCRFLYGNQRLDESTRA